MLTNIFITLHSRNLKKICCHNLNSIKLNILKYIFVMTSMLMKNSMITKCELRKPVNGVVQKDGGRQWTKII